MLIIFSCAYIAILVYLWWSDCSNLLSIKNIMLFVFFLLSDKNSSSFLNTSSFSDKCIAISLPIWDVSSFLKHYFLRGMSFNFNEVKFISSFFYDLFCVCCVCGLAKKSMPRLVIFLIPSSKRFFSLFLLLEILWFHLLQIVVWLNS